MRKIPVILDCDPGVDDMAAILVALAAPEIDVLGITAVAGNVPLAATTSNACRIVALTGRDVPVFAGAPGPLVRDQVYGKYARIGAFDPDIVPDTPKQAEREHAVRFIARTARRAAQEGAPVTICAMGPLTNIALALALHPDVARGIGRIVCMGGAFTALGHRTPWAEFNIYADPHAAEQVFATDIPVTLMPLDVTFQALFTATHIADFRARGGDAGAAMADLLTRFDRSDVARFGRPGGPLHDAMTVAWLIRPELFSGRSAAVGVQVSGQTAGYTYADFTGKTDRAPRVEVMTYVDEAGFIDLICDHIALFESRRMPN